MELFHPAVADDGDADILAVALGAGQFLAVFAENAVFREEEIVPLIMCRNPMQTA